MSVIPVYSCFHPILKSKTNPVETIDENLRKIVSDMFETMYNAPGVGLAANQVGLDKSVITIDISDKEDNQIFEPLVMINPLITAFSEEKTDYKEGCLSVPEINETVVRPESIEIVYFDINGKENKREFNDFFARVIQHEYDHLNGIIFIDRLTPLRRSLAQSKLKKIKKGLIEPEYPFIIK